MQEGSAAPSTHLVCRTVPVLEMWLSVVVSETFRGSQTRYIPEALTLLCLSGSFGSGHAYKGGSRRPHLP